MPIEIKELHIRVAVGEKKNSGSENLSPSGSDQNQMIQTCVEKVLEILKSREER